MKYVVLFELLDHPFFLFLGIFSVSFHKLTSSASNSREIMMVQGNNTLSEDFSLEIWSKLTENNVDTPENVQR